MTTFIMQIKEAVLAGEIPPIFNASDLQGIGIEDTGHNLSNYDKKNSGSSNRNKKVLVSRKINEISYYAFDETMFPSGCNSVRQL